ncbi:hypothetical protein ACWDZ4_22265 [Streptomyces sp. NPDC003016]
MNALGIGGGVLLCGVSTRTPGEMPLAPVAAADASEAAPPGGGACGQSLPELCRPVGMPVRPAAGVLAFGPDHRFTWLLCAAALLITAPCLYALIPPPRAAVAHDGHGHPCAPSPSTTAPFSGSISEETS